MQRNLWIIGAVVILIIIAFVAYFGAQPANAPVETETTATTTTIQTETGNAAVGATGESVIVAYSSMGFAPSSITIAPGTTVTWVNEGSGSMWVGGNDHPTHTHYDGTSTREHCADGAPIAPTVFDQCSAGSTGATYSFTFTKSGNWEYHNHARAGDQGKVTVRDN